MARCERRCTCVICELTIEAGDLEVQAFFRNPTKNVYFHVRCFHAWDTVEFLRAGIPSYWRITQLQSPAFTEEKLLSLLPHLKRLG